MILRPSSLKEANDFVIKNHRHSKKATGCKFCIAVLNNKKEIIGVAIVGRPVARKLDNFTTAEILRTCTNGEKNLNSFLYGACARIWKQMGGKRIITYTLETESGVSLKASGYKHTNTTHAFPKGKGWTTRKKREWQDGVHNFKKLRWEKIL